MANGVQLGTTFIPADGGGPQSREPDVPGIRISDTTVITSEGGMSVAPPGRRGGGRGGGGGSSRPAPLTQAQIKEQTRKGLVKEYRQNVANLEKEYRANLRGADRNERQRLAAELNKSIAEQRILLTAKKVEAGVIIRGEIGRKGGGQFIEGKQEAKEVIEQIRGVPTPPTTTQETRLITTEGLEVITRPPLAPQRSTITDTPQTRQFSVAPGFEEPPSIGKKIATAILPSLLITENIVLTSSEDAQEFANKLEKTKFGALNPKANIELQEFIERKRSEFQIDVNKANVLIAKANRGVELTAKEQKFIDATQIKINSRVDTSIREILNEVQNKDPTAKIKVAGFDISPKTAKDLIIVGNEAIKTQATVLAFQLGGASLGLSAPTITGTAGQQAFFRATSITATPILIGTVTAATGIQKTIEFGGDARSGIAAGIGAGLGFTSAIFSKQIVEGATNLIKNAKITKIVSVGKKGEVFGQKSRFQRTRQEFEAEVSGQKSKVTREDIKDFLNRFDKSGKTFTAPSAQEKLSRASKLWDAASTNKEKAELIKIFDETLGRDLTKEFLSQEGFLFPVEPTPPTVVTLTPIAGPPPADLGAGLPTIVGGTGATSVFAGTGQFEVTETTAFGDKTGDLITGRAVSGLDFINDVGQKTGVGFFQPSLIDSKMDTAILQKNLLLSGLDIRSAQVSKQLQKQQQESAQLSLQISAQATKQQQKSQQLLKQQQRARQRGRQGQTGLKPPIVGFPKPPKLSGTLDLTTKERARAKVLLKSYHAEVKDKGKWQKVTKKPRTRREALKIAGDIVDNSTAVSLRLIATKKKVRDTGIKGKINIKKFRDFQIRKGKRIPLKDKLIELKKHRIDTKGEIQQLSAAMYRRTPKHKKLIKSKKKKTTKPKGNFLFGGGFGSQSINLLQ